jgi:L-ascorbate metabolism protein UlaG (beta-lactamase superfamily)
MRRLTLVCAALLTACATVYYSGPESDHFDGVRFFLPGAPMERDFGDFLKWQRTRDKGAWPEWVENVFADTPPPRIANDDLRVSFVGHATVLIQTAGLNILTDPTWSERASPFGFAGPKRVNAPGIAFEDLPPIDAVVISHNHYDHLDLDTLSRLAAHSGPRVIVPLGNARTIVNHDTDIAVEEYDWGEYASLSDEVTVHLAPLQHWSARGLGDRNKALWAAFIIQAPGGSIYFAGDTGYGDGQLFRAAARDYGTPRLAILPIGAYLPEWFMAYPHMNPRDAIKAHSDLGAAYSLAHHFNTFPLADDGYDVALTEFIAQRAAAGVGEGMFRALAPGEVWVVPEP